MSDQAANQSEGLWLETRTTEGVVVAQLNRPPANALTVDFLNEIEAHFRRLEQDPNVRAIVLKGFDKVLCAGMDLKMLATIDNTEAQSEVVNALNRTYGTMYAFSKPYVVAVSGHAIAGGLFFILAADYRIAAEGPARFGLSEVRVGVAFPIAPLEIARAELSPSVARRILLSGQPVDVSGAIEAGIIDEVVSTTAMEARAIEMANALAASPEGAYAQIKQQLRAPVMEKIEAALAGREPMLDGWFTPETTKAALAVLSGKA